MLFFFLPATAALVWSLQMVWPKIWMSDSFELSSVKCHVLPDSVWEVFVWKHIAHKQSNLNEYLEQDSEKNFILAEVKQIHKSPG